MDITRRGFLKLLAAVPVSVFAPGLVAEKVRQPYVRVGDVASYIGSSPGGFIGGRCVLDVGEWNGSGYPVTLSNNSFGPYAGTEVYSDLDLADFNREVPPNFWHSPENKKRYNNVHSYVREKRYRETAEEAERYMFGETSQEAIGALMRNYG